MKILTISGKAESGKDLSASILKDLLEQNNKKVLILHYSDYLKFICKEYFNWSGKKDVAGRGILQYVGTEIVRTKNPDFWVEIIINFIDMFQENFDYFIIPDTRFPNEVNNLIEHGFNVITIHLNRINHENSLTVEQRNHLSETALDDSFFDKELYIEEGINNLENLLVDFINEYDL